MGYGVQYIIGIFRDEAVAPLAGLQAPPLGGAAFFGGGAGVVLFWLGEVLGVLAAEDGQNGRKILKFPLHFPSFFAKFSPTAH